MLRETPRFAAIAVVAPGVRFNALAILATPFFSLAIVFNVRTSSFDHARRTTFFLTANFDSSFSRAGLVAREDYFAMIATSPLSYWLKSVQYARWE
jgi:hypothetical protein